MARLTPPQNPFADAKITSTHATIWNVFNVAMIFLLQNIGINWIIIWVNLEIVHPWNILLVLLLPVLFRLWRRCDKQPAIIVPNIFFIKKIAGDRVKHPSQVFLIWFRLLEVFLIMLAIIQPVLCMNGERIFLDFYFVVVAFSCFLIEIFLKNTIFLRVP